MSWSSVGVGRTSRRAGDISSVSAEDGDTAREAVETRAKEICRNEAPQNQLPIGDSNMCAKDVLSYGNFGSSCKTVFIIVLDNTDRFVLLKHGPF